MLGLLLVEQAGAFGPGLVPLTAMSNACANGGKPSSTGWGRTSRSAVFFPVHAASHFLVSMETSCCRNDVMKKTSKIKANRFALL